MYTSSITLDIIIQIVLQSVVVYFIGRSFITTSVVVKRKGV